MIASEIRIELAKKAPRRIGRESTQSRSRDADGGAAPPAATAIITLSTTTQFHGARMF